MKKKSSNTFLEILFDWKGLILALGFLCLAIPLFLSINNYYDIKTKMEVEYNEAIRFLKSDACTHLRSATIRVNRCTEWEDYIRVSPSWRAFVYVLQGWSVCGGDLGYCLTYASSIFYTYATTLVTLGIGFMIHGERAWSLYQNIRERIPTSITY